MSFTLQISVTKLFCMKNTLETHHLMYIIGKKTCNTTDNLQYQVHNNKTLFIIFPLYQKKTKPMSAKFILILKVNI